MPDDDADLFGQDPFEKASEEESNRPEPEPGSELAGGEQKLPPMPGAPPQPDAPASATRPSAPPPPGSVAASGQAVPGAGVGQPMTPPASNGIAIAALVVGIVGLVLFFTVVAGVILGILGIVFGVLGRARARLGAPNGGAATAGLVLGIIALAASGLYFALVVPAVRDVCQQLPNNANC